MKKTFQRLIKLKRIWLLLLFPAALLLLQLAKQNLYFAEEIYAKRFFHIYSQIFSAITGVFSFSLMELFIVLGIVLIPAIIIYRLVCLIKGKGQRLFLLLKDLLSLLCIGSLVYFMLMLGCGLNYYRQPFTYYSGLTIRESSTEELTELCKELAERTNEVRSRLTSEDEDGVFMLDITEHELGELSRDSFSILSEAYPVLSGRYPIPKLILFSGTMSRTELTGVYCPFTMEANVNCDVSDYSIASTMCHELAHLRGFIREDEANYISYLACTASNQLTLQYSGLMEALILSGNALYAKNADRYYEVRATYSQAVNRDLNANSVYWAKFHDTKISNTADKLNDSYLKANDQEDGVQSYGRMVDLLLAEYRKNHGID